MLTASALIQLPTGADLSASAPRGRRRTSSRDAMPDTRRLARCGAVGLHEKGNSRVTAKAAAAASALSWRSRFWLHRCTQEPGERLPQPWR